MNRHQPPHMHSSNTSTLNHPSALLATVPNLSYTPFEDTLGRKLGNSISSITGPLPSDSSPPLILLSPVHPPSTNEESFHSTPNSKGESSTASPSYIRYSNADLPARLQPESNSPVPSNSIAIPTNGASSSFGIDDGQLPPTHPAPISFPANLYNGLSQTPPQSLSNLPHPSPMAGLGGTIISDKPPDKGKYRTADATSNINPTHIAAPHLEIQRTKTPP